MRNTFTLSLVLVNLLLACGQIPASPFAINPEDSQTLPPPTKPPVAALTISRQGREKPQAKEPINISETPAGGTKQNATTLPRNAAEVSLALPTKIPPTDEPPTLPLNNTTTPSEAQPPTEPVKTYNRAKDAVIAVMAVVGVIAVIGFIAMAVVALYKSRQIKKFKKADKRKKMRHAPSVSLQLAERFPPHMNSSRETDINGIKRALGMEERFKAQLSTEDTQDLTLQQPESMTQFIIEDPIYKGEHCVVFLAHFASQPKRKVATKQLTNQDEFTNEVEAHLAAQRIANASGHGGQIVELVGFNYAKQLILTEFLPVGNLKDHLTKDKRYLSFKEKILLAKDVCGAILAVNESGYIHSDIAARNVLVYHNKEESRLRAKLCDFGCAKKNWSDTTASGSTGDLRRLPPELVLLEITNYKPNVDTWAYGLFLWELWNDCKAEPFASCLTAEDIAELFKRMRNEQRPPIAFLSVPTNGSTLEGHLKNLIETCLCFNPDLRAAMLLVKAHPVFAQVATNVGKRSSLSIAGV